MKKVIFTALALTLAITTFTGCKDKGTTPPNTVTVRATNVTGETNGLTEVRALYTTEIDFETPGVLIPGTTVIATAPFTNNGFTMELPITVDASNLKAVTQDGFIEGITLSANFNGALAYFRGYKGTVADGVLTYSTATTAPNPVAAYLLYSDSAITITGQTPSQNGVAYEANITLIAGWQWIYVKPELVPATEEGVEPSIPEHTKIIIQTTPFTGVTLGWNYVPAE